MFLWYIVFNRFDNRKERVTEGQFIQGTWPGSTGLALYSIMASVTFWCKPSGFELSVCGASWATPRSLLNSNTL